MSSFRNLHIDENGIMYSIPNCRVFELRGNTEREILTSHLEENLLLVSIASISRTNSYLDVIYSHYLLQVQQLKKGVSKKTFTEFLNQLYKTSNVSLNYQFGPDETDEDLAEDKKTLKEKKYIIFIDTYNEALIYSQLIKANKKNRLLSMHSMSKFKKYNYVCHTNETTNVKYFGLPIYFFRATFTSAVQSVTMVKVKWIPYETIRSYRSCEVGLITIENWMAETYDGMDSIINPFISLQELQPTRYCLSYVQPTVLDVYVSIAFIALDGDNIGDGINKDDFVIDFGDNVLSHYLGDLEVVDEEDEDDDISSEYDVLKKYIPLPVLKYFNY